MARLLFVNRFYLPDQSATARMLSGVAIGLADAGHEVCVLTSIQVKGVDSADVLADVPSEEVRDGVRVVRVRSTARGGFDTRSRLTDYLSFHVAATWRALQLVKAGDVLIAKPIRQCSAPQWFSSRVDAAHCCSTGLKTCSPKLPSLQTR